MKTFGLIGYPLEHSFSRKWFSDMFVGKGVADAEYLNFQLEDISELPGLIDSLPGLMGFNVTSPYKESVMPYLDALSPEAADIGAVNCVIRDGDKLIGHNTDWMGFRDSLPGFIGNENLAALIIGSGGAAKAAAYALDSIGIAYGIVSSSRGGGPYIRYGELGYDTITSHRLIINATPLGMRPAEDAMPDIPYSALTSSHFLYDMIYNPPVTWFLREGESRGASTKNGLQMLELQAVASWRLFGLSEL